MHNLPAFTGKDSSPATLTDNGLSPPSTVPHWSAQYGQCVRVIGSGRAGVTERSECVAARSAGGIEDRPRSGQRHYAGTPTFTVSPTTSTGYVVTAHAFVWSHS